MPCQNCGDRGWRLRSLERVYRAASAYLLADDPREAAERRAELEVFVQAHANMEVRVTCPNLPKKKGETK